LTDLPDLDFHAGPPSALPPPPAADLADLDPDRVDLDLHLDPMTAKEADSDLLELDPKATVDLDLDLGLDLDLDLDPDPDFALDLEIDFDAELTLQPAAVVLVAVGPLLEGGRTCPLLVGGR
jgi:hypothetical protein